MKRSRLPITLILSLGLAACSSGETEKPAMETAPETPAEPTAKVVKTEAEWRKELTPEQFRILREAGTERAYGKVYEEFKKQGAGAYHCAGCDALLFHSDHKFDSRCGWPSFYDPANAQNVIQKKDFSAGMIRIEVVCAKCDGHLGHVFEGEGFDTPTDKRFCINGVALKYVPAAAADAKVEAKPEAEEPEKVETPTELPILPSE
jgi:peptide-methionine (R)-S-oxide reductase